MKSDLSFIVFVTIFFSNFISNTAFCTLGERVENLQASGQKKLSQQSGYTIQESDVNGTAVKEFILPSGIVFAITWRGIKHPDLSSVLGTYNTEFEKLKSQKVKALGRAPIHVQSSKVSVKMSGHMRDVHGEVYDPTLLPADFSIQDLK